MCIRDRYNTWVNRCTDDAKAAVLINRLWMLPREILNSLDTSQIDFRFHKLYTIRERMNLFHAVFEMTWYSIAIEIEWLFRGKTYTYIMQFISNTHGNFSVFYELNQTNFSDSNMFSHLTLSCRQIWKLKQRESVHIHVPLLVFTYSIPSESFTTRAQLNFQEQKIMDNIQGQPFLIGHPYSQTRSISKQLDPQFTFRQTPSF